MCKLWCYLYSSVAPGWYRALPLQRVRPLPQDERGIEPPFAETTETIGKNVILPWHSLEPGMKWAGMRKNGQFNIK